LGDAPLRHPILRVDLVRVDVGVDIEGHRQRHAVVVPACRLHVQHVVHAVHLLLERRGYSRLHRQRVRTRVGSRHDDLRWHNIGKHRHRQDAHGDHVCQHQDDRDDDRDDWSLDEESRHD